MKRNKAVEERGKMFLVVMRHNRFAGNDKGFVNIDTTVDEVCELHVAPASSDRRKVVTAPLYNQRRSILQFSLCGFKRPNKLCLKDAAYNDYYSTFFDWIVTNNSSNRVLWGASHKQSI